MLIAIFLVGSLAVLASVARLWALWQYQNTDDVSYDAIFILLFSHMEINIAIMCACAPALKPLFKTFATPFNSRNTKNSKAKDYEASSEPRGRSSAVKVTTVLPSIPRDGTVQSPIAVMKKESPEGRRVDISADTPYYTPPQEPVRSYDGGGSPIPRKESNSMPHLNFYSSDSDTASERSIPYDNSFYFRRGRRASEPAPRVPSPLLMLAEEYSVTCSSDLEEPEESVLGFVHRSSVWRRPSSMSRLSYSESPPPLAEDGTQGPAIGLQVNIEQEIRIKNRLMTPEEKYRWERKRSVFDAIDRSW